MKKLVFVLLLFGVALAQNALKVESLTKGFPNGPEDQGYLSGCSLACYSGWDTKVGDHLPSSGKLRYDAEMLSDDRFDTCWAVKPDSSGKWVELKVVGRGPEDRGSRLSGITIINGYTKTPELWAKNSRAREVRVTVDGKNLGTATLRDEPSVQLVAIDGIRVGPGSRVRLELLSRYSGTTYPEICISEVVLEGAH